MRLASSGTAHDLGGLVGDLYWRSLGVAMTGASASGNLSFEEPAMIAVDERPVYALNTSPAVGR